MMHALSPGQRARLKLAALLMVRPEVLVLDEPTNHLDREAADFLSRVVANWGGPVLATSHFRSFIESTATVIYDMDITVWKELARADGETIVGVYRNAGNYTDYLTAKTIARAKHQQIHSAQQAEKRDLHEHRREYEDRPWWGSGGNRSSQGEEVLHRSRSSHICKTNA